MTAVVVMGGNISKSMTERQMMIIMIINNGMLMGVLIPCLISQTFMGHLRYISKQEADRRALRNMTSHVSLVALNFMATVATDGKTAMERCPAEIVVVVTNSAGEGAIGVAIFTTTLVTAVFALTTYGEIMDLPQESRR